LLLLLSGRSLWTGGAQRPWLRERRRRQQTSATQRGVLRMLRLRLRLRMLRMLSAADPRLRPHRPDAQSPSPAGLLLPAWASGRWGADTAIALRRQKRLVRAVLTMRPSAFPANAASASCCCVCFLLLRLVPAAARAEPQQAQSPSSGHRLPPLRCRP
jgi:hypothetical protein